LIDDFGQEQDRPEETESDEAPAAQLDPERWVDRAAVACASIALLLSLAPAWLGRQMPVRGDALTYFWPLRRVLEAAQREHERPYYSTLNDGGTPLWLNPQTQGLYPPASLLSSLSAAEAMAISHALHLGLVFVGTVLVLRRLGYRNGPAAFGALATALGGTFLSLSAMLDKLHSGAWLPLLLWGILGMRKGGLLPRIVVMGSIAMAVLAGGLDIVVIGILLGLAVAGTGLAGADPDTWQPEEALTPEAEDDLATLAFEGLPVGVDWDAKQEDEEGGGEEAEEAIDEGPGPFRKALKELRFILPDIARTGSWMAAGLAITATQWLPFRLWLNVTTWADGIEASELAARALHFPDLLGLLVPNVAYFAEEGIYRAPGTTEAMPFYLPGLYVGGAGLVLGLLGILGGVRRPGPGRWALAYTALSTGLAFGPAMPPMYWLLGKLPLLSSIRYPEKWLIPAALGGAVLIAEGARLIKDRDIRSDILVGILAGLMAVGVLVGVIGLGTDPDGDARRVMTRMAIALLSGSATALLWYFADAQRLGQSAAALALVAFGLFAMDLGHYNLPLAPLERADELVKAPVAVQTIIKDTRSRRRMASGGQPMRARIYQASYAQHPEDPVSRRNAPLHHVVREALLGGVGAVWNLEIMRDWMVMPTQALEDRFTAIEKLPLPQQVDGLRLAGVTHMVVHFRDDALDLSPRIGQGLQALPTPEGRWTNVVVFAIENPLPSCRWTPRSNPSSDGLPVSEEVDSNGSWKGRVTSQRPGYLVCIRPFDPAWKAWVSGVKTPVEQVNNYQLAVPIPPGSQEVRLEYKPPGIALARTITLVGIAVSFFSLGLGGLFRRRRERQEPTEADEAEAAPAPLPESESEPSPEPADS